MTPERWRQIQAVFDTVVDAPNERRSEILAQACGTDLELRDQVAALVAADAGASA